MTKPKPSSKPQPKPKPELDDDTYSDSDILYTPLSKRKVLANLPVLTPNMKDAEGIYDFDFEDPRSVTKYFGDKATLFTIDVLETLKSSKVVALIGQNVWLDKEDRRKACLETITLGEWDTKKGKLFRYGTVHFKDSKGNGGTLWVNRQITIGGNYVYVFVE